MLNPKGSIDARQYAAAFVTQCTLSLNDRGGSWAGLCHCGSFVMFCAPDAKILTEVSEKSYTRKIRFVVHLLATRKNTVAISEKIHHQSADMACKLVGSVLHESASSVLSSPNFQPQHTHSRQPPPATSTHPPRHKTHKSYPRRKNPTHGNPKPKEHHCCQIKRKQPQFIPYQP